MPPKPNSSFKKPDPGKRAYSAIGRTVKTAPATKTPSYTGDEARKMQDKQSKKSYKNPKNTKSSARSV